MSYYLYVYILSAAKVISVAREADTPSGTLCSFSIL